MSPGGVQPMVGTVQYTENSTTLSECSGVRAGICEMMAKDAEQFMTFDKMMRTKRCQTQEFMQ